MKELLQNKQSINIIPQDFKWANKGTVVEVSDNGFVFETKYPSEGIICDNICEFYSQTPNGILFFESGVNKIDGNKIYVQNPIKHRFLQRRKFTRIKFIQELEMTCYDVTHKISTLDISAGGMKFVSKDNINIEYEYKIVLPLLHEQEIKCKFVPIRIEKNDGGFYTLSGRFKNMTNIDKMTLVQFCMKKNMENVNK